MNLSIFSAIIFSITIASSAIPISENYVSWSSDSNCLDFDDSRDPNAVCEATTTWKRSENSSCIVSVYYVKKEKSSGTSNGIPQCSKTPCDATEKIVVDCETAFREKLANINH
ncbi:UPF0375 protein R05A10.4 [Caenorhabditis elegans]|uniref:UPF0375 protein R05A10.4 n=1 Tax=Caenorhabditis elegans TaxID=6239 RepID=U375C_CAEEL|nr:UPF0375 protein R05A10.4 [Caenorhabditis elegans]O45700.1 RecName: Full=UPF0375 protein R05A10.4; Flags: Precursor [Caenorhabditis elegans]CAB05264.1 UPF0375 protein R05A10.4 [Caenorhabditis elegans]|eukprot:NP_502718.1 UPF0375 protein R05A10.4 [Caenorhabditis elegans]